MSEAGVYQIRNTVNNHIYVGSAVKTKRRKQDHFSALRHNRHENSHLQRAWNKYGEDNFMLEVLFACAPSLCMYYEQQVLNQWKPSYNICPTASNGRLGLPHTEETKAKISKAKMGNQYNLGRKHTEEHNAKISKAAMGHTRTRGDQNHFSKLSELDVYEIRRLYATGRVTKELLGKMFKVGGACIGKIVYHKTWRHLQ